MSGEQNKLIFYQRWLLSMAVKILINQLKVLKTRGFQVNICYIAPNVSNEKDQKDVSYTAFFGLDKWQDSS